MGKDRFDIKDRETLGLITDARVIVDKETGVNYLFRQSGYSGGMTVLLDREGKPVVTPVTERYN